MNPAVSPLPAPRVSIVIPTFRRPARVLAAVRSALMQRSEGDFDIVVVDNDPAGSALAPVGELAATVSIPVTVVHEPRPGVAHARNAGVKAARGAMIAFLDDDEIAPEAWLGELMRVQADTQADVVFGPVCTLLEAQPPEHGDFYEAFFARNPGLPDGLTDQVFGCGCSLIRRASLPDGEPFSAARNEIGGEDDLLFERMRAAGARFAFARDAFVWETPDPARVTLAYTLKRAFAYGQGPAYKAWSHTPPDWPRVILWMGVGLAQTLVRIPVAAFAFAARSKRRAFAYRRAVEAVGKVLWFPAFKLRFYGDSQIRAAQPRLRPSTH